MSSSAPNPYLAAAAEGAAWEELRRMEWEEQVRVWNQYLEGCHEFLVKSGHTRLLLAAEALQQWGWITKLHDVTRSESHTGRIFFKTKLVLLKVDSHHAHLEFICSPASSIIGAEAERKGERRRWPKAAIHSPDLPTYMDQIIRDFLHWGMSLRS